MSVDEEGSAVSRLHAGYRSVVSSRKVQEFTRHKLNLVGFGIVLCLTVAGVFAPWVAPSDPINTNIADRRQPPNSDHLMGTDSIGRDVFSRMIYGARISLKYSVLTVSISLLIGIVMGLVSGYVGGWVDEAIMRLVDLLMAYPGILLSLVVVSVLGASLLNIMIALAISGWTGYARLIRGEVLSVKEAEYIKAAEAMGASRSRIMFRHILPNIIGPIVVLATLNLGGAAVGTAGLSFLGFGAQPPTPEWGQMLASSRDTLTSAWWIATFPGLMIMLTVLGFNLLGDGLRDVLDPRDQTDQRGPGL